MWYSFITFTAFSLYTTAASDNPLHSHSCWDPGLCFACHTKVSVSLHASLPFLLPLSFLFNYSVLVQFTMHSLSSTAKFCFSSICTLTACLTFFSFAAHSLTYCIHYTFFLPHLNLAFLYLQPHYLFNFFHSLHIPFLPIFITLISFALSVTINHPSLVPAVL